VNNSDASNVNNLFFYLELQFFFLTQLKIVSLVAAENERILQPEPGMILKERLSHRSGWLLP